MNQKGKKKKNNQKLVCEPCHSFKIPTKAPTNERITENQQDGKVIGSFIHVL